MPGPEPKEAVGFNRKSSELRVGGPGSSGLLALFGCLAWGKRLNNHSDPPSLHLYTEMIPLDFLVCGLLYGPDEATIGRFKDVPMASE